MAGRLRCAKGIHERSERHVARAHDGSYVSICRYCRARMKRRAKRDWLVISRAEFKSLTQLPPS
jgi:hypothetical protein